MKDHEVVSFEEFSHLYRDIRFDEAISEGFGLIDKEAKGYIGIDDLKRLNGIFRLQFSEDDLEGLIEIAGNSNSKISLEDFSDFIKSGKSK